MRQYFLRYLLWRLQHVGQGSTIQMFRPYILFQLLYKTVLYPPNWALPNLIATCPLNIARMLLWKLPHSTAIYARIQLHFNRIQRPDIVLCFRSDQIKNLYTFAVRCGLRLQKIQQGKLHCEIFIRTISDLISNIKTTAHTLSKKSSNVPIYLFCVKVKNSPPLLHC